MSSSMVLCHDCLAWVAPRDDRCPQCLDAFDAGRQPPSVHELQQMIGEVRVTLGEVAVKRKFLPELGMLYATERGLFFAPHELRTSDPSLEKEKESGSLFWVLMGLIWTPFMFFAPLFRSEAAKANTSQKLAPRRLEGDGALSLAELLQRSPGAFFLQRRSLRHLRRRGTKLLADCQTGSRWKMYLAGDVTVFRQRLTALGEETDWRGLITG